jgi:hypothetical protein
MLEVWGLQVRGKKDALGGLLKRIGSFEPLQFQSDFNARLILQKTVYLLEQFGLNIGYDFSWYLRGPYSPSLARDAYTVAKSYSEVQAAKFADPSKEKRFCMFLSFIKPIAEDYSSLEKVASIHFLFKVYPHSSSKDIFVKAKAKIPSLTFEEFQEISTVLEKWNLLEGYN